VHFLHVLEAAPEPVAETADTFGLGFNRRTQLTELNTSGFTLSAH
jgi:hypothetical protein